jgi:hypothetical protein
VALCCGAAAGCGGSSQATSSTRSAASNPAAAPPRVCGRALAAARPLLGPRTKVKIADSDPANIECLVSGGGVKLDVNAQASPRAWEQFDTVAVHQAQAFEARSKKEPGQLPVDLPPRGDQQAVWIPANAQYVATNGSQSSGGSYLTVVVTRKSRRGPSSLKLADAVGSAALAVAPRGPSPGPPPS